MKLTISKIPDISEYLEYTYPVTLGDDVTVLVTLKTMHRDDDVFINIYLNEVSNDTLIISGKKLTAESIVCQPNYNLGFNYNVMCVDQDGIHNDIKKYNTNKFYLQFTSYDGGNWITE